MMRLPRPPEGLGDVFRFCRELWQYLSEIEPMVSTPDSLLRRTTSGSVRTPIGRGRGGGGTGTGGMNWKGQWADGTYSKNDVVIRDYTWELDEGNEAGTYIATDDVVAGDLPPNFGSTGGSGCTLSVTVSGGVITGITVTAGGTGYPPNCLVVITDATGTGASASAVVNSSGVVTGVTVSAGGSGYSGSPSASITSGSQKWATVADAGHEQRHTYRNGNQVVIVDCGRDSMTLPSILIYKTYPNGGSPTLSDGCILLDLNILLGISGPPGNLVIEPREVAVCVEGTTKHAVFLCTDWY